MEILSRDLEEYDVEGERPTRIMSLQTYPNTGDTNHIGLYMLYQANNTNYIKRSTEFKKNLRKSYTVLWEFCNKQLQSSIKMNV